MSIYNDPPVPELDTKPSQTSARKADWHARKPGWRLQSACQCRAPFHAQRTLKSSKPTPHRTQRRSAKHKADNLSVVPLLICCILLRHPPLRWRSDSSIRASVGALLPRLVSHPLPCFFPGLPFSQELGCSQF
jgi:hypothetical protein